MRIGTLYLMAVCFAAGYYWAKDDTGTEMRQLARDLYDGVVDYTVARAAAQRHRSERELAGAM